MAKKITLVVLALNITFLPIISIPAVANADIQSCTADVYQQSVQVGSNLDFQIAVNNTDNNPIRWVRVTRPSENFVFLSANFSSWPSSSNSEQATFSGGTIDPYNLDDRILINTIATTAAPSANWIVEVSDSTLGTNPHACQGNLGTTITDGPQDTTPPSIHNVSATNIKSTYVTINWTTDRPATSQVNYGYDEQYGSSTPYDSSLKLNHSVQLTGLTPDQAYHYQVVSRNEQGNESVTGDNTFITARIDLQNSIDTTVAPKTKIPIKAVPTEKVPPAVTISTNFDKPYKKVPLISGKVTDNEAVAGIEYSTDGGKNWLLVDQEIGLGTKQSTYSFKPINLDDGNYKIIVRAVDTSGNVGVSDVKTLIIDRLPPLVGGSVVSSGPQIFQPNENGVIFSLAGVDQKITFSSVGGAESITINAKKVAGKSEQKTFTLTKQPDTGLWTGILSFKEPGGYTLNADSIDGANNKTSKVVGTVQVLKPGRILSSKNKVLPDAKVTLYYLEPTTNVWSVWDGASYDQKNPQLTDSKGEYSLYVPPGKYYLKADAKNHRTLISNVFEVKKQSMPILSELNMKEARNFSIGNFTMHIPPFSNDTVELKLPQLVSSQSILAKQLIDRNVPDFALKNLKGEIVRPLDYNGKPTLIVFISSWSPPSREQLSSLANLQKNSDINVVPIVSQEGSGKINSTLKIAGLSLEMLTDNDSSAVESFKVQALPTHYFIDRKGVVKKVMVGVLSEDKILGILSGGN